MDVSVIQMEPAAARAKLTEYRTALASRHNAEAHAVSHPRRRRPLLGAPS
jgi:hypothetical protein